MVWHERSRFCNRFSGLILKGDDTMELEQLDTGQQVLDSRVLADQQLNECAQQCFAASAHVVSKLEY